MSLSPESTKNVVEVSEVLADPELLAHFLSDILLHAYVAYGPEYLLGVLNHAEIQAELHETQQQ